MRMKEFKEGLDNLIYIIKEEFDEVNLSNDGTQETILQREYLKGQLDIAMAIKDKLTKTN